MPKKIVSNWWPFKEFVNLGLLDSIPAVILISVSINLRSDNILFQNLDLDKAERIQPKIARRWFLICSFLDDGHMEKLFPHFLPNYVYEQKLTTNTIYR